MNILVLNSGSSSLKYKLFDMEKEEVLADGKVERIGDTIGLAVVTHRRNGGEKYCQEKEIANHQAALKVVLDLLTDPEQGVLADLSEINAVGHRVLHGAEYFRESVAVDEEVLDRLEELKELGPLHMPANIMGIRACREIMHGVKQVAVFDTAFHQTMPEWAYLYALPFELYKKYKIRRYGFHGTSHRYVSGRAAELLNRPLAELKMITLHLGNGSSMAAVDGGKVIDTSMGFTPLAGLVMGTRSGDIDPSVMPLICRIKNLSVDEATDFLNKKSGFLGMCGYSDMRDVQRARTEGNPEACTAYQMFLYRIIKYVGAYYVALKGLDALIFTAGIGENDDIVRRDICRELAFMGVKIDEDRNKAVRSQEADLSAPDSRVKVLVIPTDEELVIARDTYRLSRSS